MGWDGAYGDDLSSLGGLASTGLVQGLGFKGMG